MPMIQTSWAFKRWMLDEKITHEKASYSEIANWSTLVFYGISSEYDWKNPT